MNEIINKILNDLYLNKAQKSLNLRLEVLDLLKVKPKIPLIKIAIKINKDIRTVKKYKAELIKWGLLNSK